MVEILCVKDMKNISVKIDELLYLESNCTKNEKDDFINMYGSVYNVPLHRLDQAIKLLRICMM